LFEHPPKGWTNGVAFELARLIVGALQCGKLALAAKPGVRNRSLQHPDRLAVDRSRQRKVMPVLAAMGDRKPPANSGYRVAPSSDKGDALGADMLGVNFAGGNCTTVPGSERFSLPATGQRDLAADHHDARIPIMRVFGVHRARLELAVEDLVALATQISLEFALVHDMPSAHQGSSFAGSLSCP